MSNDFLKHLVEAMCEEIENPGEICATEQYIIYKPASWTDEEWNEYVEGLNYTVPQIELDEEVAE